MVYLSLAVRTKLLYVLILKTLIKSILQWSHRFICPAPVTERLIQYCNHNKLHLIIGCDTNAHHFRLGSQECNRRGYTLSEYLATTDPEVVNQEVVNQGSEPTFFVNNKRTVIDVTLATNAILSVIRDWQVMPNDSFSDHRQIQFVIKQDKRPPNCRSS